jgi:hypothetical protein
MAKNLALLALILCVAALFLPLRSLIGITEGAFAGSIKNVALGLMLTVPSLIAVLFGATVGRKGFRRGLGALHLIFGGIAVALCFFASTNPAGIKLEIGGYMAFAGAALTLVAGLIGLVKPDPK